MYAADVNEVNMSIASKNDTLQNHIQKTQEDQLKSIFGSMKYGKENLKLVNLPKIEEEGTPKRMNDEEEETPIRIDNKL